MTTNSTSVAHGIALAVLGLTALGLSFGLTSLFLLPQELPAEGADPLVHVGPVWAEEQAPDLLGPAPILADTVKKEGDQVRP
jgi:hypothetical protein